MEAQRGPEQARIRGVFPVPGKYRSTKSSSENDNDLINKRLPLILEHGSDIAKAQQPLTGCGRSVDGGIKIDADIAIDTTTISHNRISDDASTHQYSMASGDLFTLCTGYDIHDTAMTVDGVPIAGNSMTASASAEVLLQDTTHLLRRPCYQ